MIRKEDGKFIVYSKDGKKLSKPYASKKEAEARLAEIERIKHAKMKAGLEEVELVITKSSVQADGTRRWMATTSDTGRDRVGEQTSLALYQDWIERIETGKSASFLPPPRKPFLGVSHYPSLDGDGEAGEADSLYIDGDRFKAKGLFTPTGLGLALAEAVQNEQSLIKRGEFQGEPIRISAAWWDISHSHGDYVFERKSLAERCPMCEGGAGDKTYLKGQLDHFAATRVPINPRTDITLEEKAMTKTRKEDAASIIGDELAEELEGKAKPVGKAEVEELPEAMAVRAEADEPETVEEQPETAPVTLAAARELAENNVSHWQLVRDVLNNILTQTTDPDQLKAQVRGVISEFGDQVEALKASLEDAYLLEPVIEPATTQKGGYRMAENTREHPADVFKAAMDGILANSELDQQTKLQQLQEQFNALGEAVKAEVTGEDTALNSVARSLSAVADKLDLMMAKMDKQQPVQPQAAPVQKSHIPGVGQQAGEPVSPLRAMIRRSVGLPN